MEDKDPKPFVLGLSLFIVCDWRIDGSRDSLFGQ
jgi:hypothetical protein